VDYHKRIWTFWSRSHRAKEAVSFVSPLREPLLMDRMAPSDYLTREIFQDVPLFHGCFLTLLSHEGELGYLSRYSDWLRAGWQRGQEIESLESQKFLLLHIIQTGCGVHITSCKMGTGALSGGKATGAWSWPLTSNCCRGQENVDLYIHSPIRLHGVMLN
jgi:hypothetical protein